MVSGMGAPEPYYSWFNPLIRYNNLSSHPIEYDLRLDPTQNDIQFLNLPRAANELDMLQLVTNPPALGLFLSHPRLPWLIVVKATHPNGVTINDVLTQIYENLQTPIDGRDYYNSELDSSDREEITTAFNYRNSCNTGGEGIKRVDFLGLHVRFLGLKWGKNGTWEMKTLEAVA